MYLKARISKRIISASPNTAAACDTGVLLTHGISDKTTQQTVFA